MKDRLLDLIGLVADRLAVRGGRVAGAMAWALIGIVVVVGMVSDD